MALQACTGLGVAISGSSVTTTLSEVFHSTKGYRRHKQTQTHRLGAGGEAHRLAPFAGKQGLQQYLGQCGTGMTISRKLWLLSIALTMLIFKALSQLRLNSSMFLSNLSCNPLNCPRILENAYCVTVSFVRTARYLAKTQNISHEKDIHLDGPDSILSKEWHRNAQGTRLAFTGENECRDIQGSKFEATRLWPQQLMGYHRTSLWRTRIMQTTKYDR